MCYGIVCAIVSFIITFRRLLNDTVLIFSNIVSHLRFKGNTPQIINLISLLLHKSCDGIHALIHLIHSPAHFFQYLDWRLSMISRLVGTQKLLLNHAFVRLPIFSVLFFLVCRIQIVFGHNNLCTDPSCLAQLIVCLLHDFAFHLPSTGLCLPGEKTREESLVRRWAQWAHDAKICTSSPHTLNFAMHGSLAIRFSVSLPKINIIFFLSQFVARGSSTTQ